MVSNGGSNRNKRSKSAPELGQVKANPNQPRALKQAPGSSGGPQATVAQATAVSQPSRKAPQKQQPKSAGSNSTDNQPQRDHSKSVEIAGLVASIIAAGAAIGGLWISHSQLKEMEAQRRQDKEDGEASDLRQDKLIAATQALATAAGSQVQLAEGTRKAEFRPYIGIVPNSWIAGIDQFTGIEEFGPHLSGVVTLQNWGKAPSLETRLIAGISYVQKGRDLYAGVRKRRIPVVENIAPGVEHPIKVVADSRTQAAENMFALGGSLIVLAGEASYSDAYGKHHSTKFCYFVDKPVVSRPVACLSGNTNQ